MSFIRIKFIFLSPLPGLHLLSCYIPLLPYCRPAGAGTNRLMGAYISKLFLFHWKNTKNIRFTCSKWDSPGWGGSLADRLFKLNETSPGRGDTLFDEIHPK